MVSEYILDFDLTPISQWLGHSKYETTLIYAKADTEQKRRAMENTERIVINKSRFLNNHHHQHFPLSYFV